MKKLIYLLMILTILFSCEKESETKIFQYDFVIKKYVTMHNETDSVFYYFNKGNELLLIKSFETILLNGKSTVDSSLSYMESNDNYKKIGEIYYYYDDQDNIIKINSFGENTINEYIDNKKVYTFLESDSNEYTKYVYNNDILVTDTQHYRINEGYAVIINSYSYYDTLSPEILNLEFIDLGGNIKTKYLLKSKTYINYPDNKFFIDTTINYYNYTINQNMIEKECRVFQDKVELEQFYQKLRLFRVDKE